MQLSHRVAAAFAHPLCWSLFGLTGLTSCGGGDSFAPTDALKVVPQGTPPFISSVPLQGVRVKDLAAVHYTIAPKPGASARPVDVRYTIDALSRRGNVDVANDQVALPVFGLYAGYANQVSIELTYADASTQAMSIELTTAAYADPNAIYDRPTILKAREPGSALGFDYLALKNMNGGPIIIDTDGAIRWVAPAAVTDSTSTAFFANGFEVGAKDSTVLWRFELDGTVTPTTLDNQSGYTNFHHNIDHGKTGLLVELDRQANGAQQLESTLAEVTPDGSVIQQWDLAAIFSDLMRNGGDDPAAFVRPGIDWFHMNATTYDPNDDSLVVSSRENFVVKIDYQSGRIVWIFGDPTKYWFSFASLRAKALSLPAGDLYPIGQHGISITSGGNLMLFNNGLGSLSQPAGTSAGDSRDYSAVSTYAIDAATLSAHEVRRFDHDRTILSQICSSAYQADDHQSLLIDYAVADNRTHTRLMGLDPSQNVAFDFEYPTTPCTTSWNAIPVPLQALTFE